MRSRRTMAGNVLFQNQHSQQPPYRGGGYGPGSPSNAPDQLQFYSSNYNQYGTETYLVKRADDRRQPGRI